MSYLLTEQASQFMAAMYAGMILSGIYDILRIFRRIVRHKNIYVNIEDFVFWNFVGVFLYVLIFLMNDGIIRWFIIASAVVGAYIFHQGIGKYVVKYVTITLKFVINKLLKKTVKKVKIALKRVTGKLGRSYEAESKKKSSKNKIFKKIK